jgi:hypothetical protein
LGGNDDESKKVTSINGLTYQADYITQQYHDELLEIIDRQEWGNRLKRRV